MKKNDEFYMKKAVELAKIAAFLGEVPVGALVVKKSTGEIVGEGFNRREYGKSPLTHSEIIAIHAASQRLGGWRLVDCELFVTLEPCPMCAGAVINSRIERVIFGAYDKKNGCGGSAVNLFELSKSWNPTVTGGILEEECSSLLTNFFKGLRKNTDFR